MASITQNAEEIPVKIVGSSIFGRYPFISAERTYNMFISDDALVNFAGYEEANSPDSLDREGRGIFHSIRGNFLLVVVANKLYKITDINSFAVVRGTFDTFSGEVFMDENLASQIMIVDGSNAYIYNWHDDSFGKPTTIEAQITAGTLIPNYVTYQNTHFIVGNGALTPEGSQWYVYLPGTGFQLGVDVVQLGNTFYTLTLQTKPDYAKAALRIPGKGNSLLVLGSSVGEIWQDIGDANIYRRNSTVNIDYGCISVATIASSDDYVAWLGINEKSSASIMVMTGGGAERLSTDGIDYLLSTIQHPTDSTAMFYRQDGHVFYQITFFNAADNITIVYDFTTKKFYDLTDHNYDYHPARQFAFFQNHTYFVSKKNGHVYQMGTDITVYSTNASTVYEIPRIRTCDTQRMPRPEKFRVNLFTFTIENGTEEGVNYVADCVGYLITESSNGALVPSEVVIITEEGLPILAEGGYCGIYKPRIDVSISKNGGRDFSSSVPYYMHKTAHYKNQPRFNRLGSCNMITIQMRFWGFWRFISENGIIEISQ